MTSEQWSKKLSTSCMVLKCDNKKGDRPRITLILFPKEPNLYKSWCDHLNIPPKYRRDRSMMYICLRHFDEKHVVRSSSNIMLQLRDAIPCYYLNGVDKESESNNECPVTTTRAMRRVTAMTKPIATVMRPIPTVIRPIGTVLRPISTVMRPISTVMRPISTVMRPITTVMKPISTVIGPTTPIIKDTVEDDQLSSKEDDQADCFDSMVPVENLNLSNVLELADKDPLILDFEIKTEVEEDEIVEQPITEQLSVPVQNTSITWVQKTVDINGIVSPVISGMESTLERLKKEVEEQYKLFKKSSRKIITLKQKNDRIARGIRNRKKKVRRQDSTEVKIKDDLLFLLKHKDICTTLLELHLEKIKKGHSYVTKQYSAEIVDFSLRLQDISSISYYYVFETFGFTLPTFSTIKRYRNIRNSKGLKNLAGTYKGQQLNDKLEIIEVDGRHDEDEEMGMINENTKDEPDSDEDDGGHDDDDDDDDIIEEDYGVDEEIQIEQDENTEEDEQYEEMEFLDEELMEETDEL